MNRVHKKSLLRFARHKLAVVGFVITCVLLLVSLFAPYLAPEGYNAMDLSRVREGISRDHLLGTDEFGRSILSRITWGCRSPPGGQGGYAG